ncbi:MAG: 3-coathanger stack domain-containing protein [Cellulophaga sp.]
MKNHLLQAVFAILLLGATMQAQDSTEFDFNQIKAVLGTTGTLEHSTTNLDGVGLKNIDPRAYVCLSLKENLLPDNWFSYTLRMNVVTADATGAFTGTSKEVSLTVENNKKPGASNLTTDISKQVEIGAYGIRIEALEGSYTLLSDGSAAVSNGAVPENIVLEIGFTAETYTELSSTVPHPISVVDGNELSLTWDAIPGTLSYDVEWTWVDAYNGASPTLLRPQNTVPFTIRDFQHNSTRVQTTNAEYSIPLIYAKGYILFRVRAVGKHLEDTTKFKYGNWSMGNEDEQNINFVGDWNSSYVQTLATDHQIDKNWQFQASYAEEGKKKEVVSYFDGTLRNRQTVTKINSDDNVIVGEVIYDAQGRPAVEVLPVPISKTTSVGINYVHNFTQNSTGAIYSYQDFDTDDRNVLDDPTALKTMSTASGASRYYSTDNDVAGLFKNRVPNAEGHPFSQIEYMADNTGRIRRKSGVGVQHQLGSRHEMEYYYGTPEQKELNRLFGYSVGNFTHYKKNMVIDPNRQVSISYIDPQGRTIATALSGVAPSNLDALQDETNESLHERIDVDLFGKLSATDADTTLDNNNRQSSGKFGALEDALSYNFNKLTAQDDERNFSYTLTQSDFGYQCANGTLNYPVIYDLFIDILNADNESLIVDPTNVDYSNFTVNVKRGNYSIVKKLVVNADTLEQYADDYITRLTTEGDSCYLAPSDVVPVPTAIEDGCFISCQDCEDSLIAEYGGEIGYVASRKENYDFSDLENILTAAELEEEKNRLSAAFAQQWNKLIRACNAPCLDSSSDLTGISNAAIVAGSLTCQIARTELLNDMKPTGQYGQYPSTLNGDKAVEVIQSTLNIFNEENTLPSASVGSEYNSWRNPNHPEYDVPPTNSGLNTNGHYYNTDGTISYIRVKEIINEETGDITYSPEILEGIELIDATQNTNNKEYFIEPQYLTKAEDFIATGIWQDQWAESLLVYHPEYCYLKYTEILCGITKYVGGNLMNSDSYDQYLRSEITSYSLAGSLATGNSIMTSDPFFSGNILSEIRFDIRNTMMTTMLNNYNNTGKNLEQFVYTLIRCNSITENCPSGSFTSLSSSEKEEYWSLYKANYINLKQTVKKLYADIYAKYNGCYNGCIGEKEAPENILSVIAEYSFNSKNSLDNIISGKDDPVCAAGGNVKSAFESKEKRFKPSDIMHDSGKDPADVVNDMAAYTNYEYYNQTGLCPLGRDLQVYLENAFIDFVSEGISGTNRPYTGKYLSRDLYKDFGGSSPSNGELTIDSSPSSKTLTITFRENNTAVGEIPLTITLPDSFSESWNNYGNNRWVITKINTIRPDKYDAANKLFPFKAVAQIRTSLTATSYTEVILSGTTQARISECTTTPNPDSIGQYIGNGKSSGILGDCNKEARFSKAFAGLLNELFAKGKISGSDVSLASYPSYTTSYLQTFFGGSGATWSSMPGNIYILEVGQEERLVLTLENSIPESNVAYFTGLGIDYKYNEDNLIVKQQARISYMDASLNRGVSILGGMGQGGFHKKPFVNFLCCEGEDINDLAGNVERTYDPDPCVEGIEPAIEVTTTNILDLFNDLLAQPNLVYDTQLTNVKNAYTSATAEQFLTNTSAENRIINYLNTPDSPYTGTDLVKDSFQLAGKPMHYQITEGHLGIYFGNFTGDQTQDGSYDVEFFLERATTAWDPRNVASIESMEVIEGPFDPVVDLGFRASWVLLSYTDKDGISRQDCVFAQIHIENDYQMNLCDFAEASPDIEPPTRCSVSALDFNVFDPLFNDLVNQIFQDIKQKMLSGTSTDRVNISSFTSLQNLVDNFPLKERFEKVAYTDKGNPINHAFDITNARYTAIFFSDGSFDEIWIEFNEYYGFVYEYRLSNQDLLEFISYTNHLTSSNLNGPNIAYVTGTLKTNGFANGTRSGAFVVLFDETIDTPYAGGDLLELCPFFDGTGTTSPDIALVASPCTIGLEDEIELFTNGFKNILNHLIQTEPMVVPSTLDFISFNSPVTSDFINQTQIENRYINHYNNNVRQESQSPLTQGDFNISEETTYYRLGRSGGIQVVFGEYSFPKLENYYSFQVVDGFNIFDISVIDDIQVIRGPSDQYNALGQNITWINVKYKDKTGVSKQSTNLLYQTLIFQGFYTNLCELASQSPQIDGPETKFCNFLNVPTCIANRETEVLFEEHIARILNMAITEYSPSSDSFDYSNNVYLWDISSRASALALENRFQRTLNNFVDSGLAEVQIFDVDVSSHSLNYSDRTVSESHNMVLRFSGNGGEDESVEILINLDGLSTNLSEMQGVICYDIQYDWVSGGGVSKTISESELITPMFSASVTYINELGNVVTENAGFMSIGFDDGIIPSRENVLRWDEISGCDFFSNLPASKSSTNKKGLNADTNYYSEFNSSLGRPTSQEPCSVGGCIPPIPELKSCTEEYPEYVTLMNTIGDKIEEEGDVVNEAEFCANSYQYLVDDYKYYLQTAFGVTSTLDLNYMSIARFGATEFNFGYSGIKGIINGYKTHVVATRNNDNEYTKTWAQYTSEYLNANPGTCVPKPFPVDFSTATIEIPEDTPCEQFRKSVTAAYTKDVYESVLAAKRQEFINSYLEHALNTPVETFSMNYLDKEYQYTLYYYDQAGNLTQTVPPEGVDRFTDEELNGGIDTQINDYRNLNTAEENTLLLPDHALITEYRYNSLNQLVWQKTPDGGETRFAYDKLGRIIASQNAKQLGNNRFSYTTYDGLGRISEAGEMTPNLAIDIEETTGKLVNSGDGTYVDTVNTYPANISDTQYEVTKTTYSSYDLYSPLELFNSVLDRAEANASSRNRVTAISYYNIWGVGGTTSTIGYDNATYYNYDIHGNVQELVQHNRLLTLDANDPFSAMKRVLYQYDLISGNVNKVLYQDGQSDMFGHRYTYDADNRITRVETSSDGMIWEKDAKYQYFAHGPLARTVLGAKEVQGIDYAYTLQGWLKGVNSERMTTTADMGNDGASGSQVAQDAMGYSLSYFDNDYKSGIASSAFSYSSNTSLSTTKNLYNGNIKQMVTSLLDNDESLMEAQMNHYEYDQLNRIKSFKGNGVVAGNLSPSYEADYKYDRNGNLASLTRKVKAGSGLTTMDQLSYHYNEVDRGSNPISGQRNKAKLNNQLTHVDDSVGDTGFNDLGNQTANNYQYDAIGQLISDRAEGITNIEWRVDGKVRKITKNGRTANESTILFQYDGLGNRITKTEVETKKTTLYVRDAQGNVMAVYNSNSNGKIGPGEEPTLPFDINLVNLQVTDIQEHKAVNTIDIHSASTGENTVEPGGDLTFTAGKGIVLLPNFHIKAGSTFLAEIKDLSGGGNNNNIVLAEHHIYGSSRLGLEQKNLEMDKEDGNLVQTLFENKVGDKRYELSNHLGNVLSVVTDRKLIDSNGELKPDVVAYNDYFPFGMLLPNRHGNTSDYRYGFQGQEMDNEVKGEGNSLNYKYRMHDPRVGRFFAPDPLERNYPYYTPYSFSGNKVIAFRELEGMEHKYYALYLNEFGGNVHELQDKEQESSFFSPDSKTLTIYNEDSGKPLVQYRFQKDRWTLFEGQSINLYNKYEKYSEFVEDPIGSMLSGEFKSQEEVFSSAVEDAIIALVMRRMSKLPKGSKRSKLISSSRNKKMPAWLVNIREGIKFQTEKLTKLDKDGVDYAGNIRVVPKNGKGNAPKNRTNADALINNGDGTYTIIEYKLTTSSRLSTGQRAAKNYINKKYSRKKFEIRSNIDKWKLKAGDEIKIREYKIEYKGG